MTTMKRNLLLLLYLLMPFIIMAEDISEEQAKLIAADFLSADQSAGGLRRAAAAMQLSYSTEAGEI